MVKLSEQLKKEEPAKRTTRTERVLRKQLQRESLAEQKKLKRLEEELEQFKEKVTYETYEEEYLRLSPEAKKGVLTPSELKGTEEYKKYQAQKSAYEKQLAEYQEAQKRERDIRIARKFFVEGKTPLALTKAQQKYYYALAEDRELYEEKIKQPEKFTTDLPIYKQDPILKQAVIKGEVIPKIDSETRKITFEEVQKEPPPTPVIEPVEPEYKEGKTSTVIGWIGEKTKKVTTKVGDFVKGYSLAIGGTTFPKVVIQKTDPDSVGQEALKIATKEIATRIKKGYEVIPDKKLPTYKEGLKEVTLEYLNIQKQQAMEREAERIGLDKIAEEEQALKQQDFESRYLKKIQEGEITFDKARREYEKSDTARLIDQRYEQRIKNALAQADISKETFKILGLEKAGAVKYLPTTYKGAVVGALGLKAGLTIYSKIPSKVIYGGVTALGVKGAYDYLAPASDPVKRATGLVTAGTSGLILTYGGLKFLKIPTTRAIKIPKPKPTITSKEILGVQTKTGAVFSKQQIAQYSTTGTRIATSRKWRDLVFSSVKKLGFKVKDDWLTVTKGIPAERVSKTSRVVGLRGTNVIRELSKYGKELRVFERAYKLPKSKVQALLRGSLPRYQELILKKGAVVTTKKGVALKRIDYILRQPRIIIDKALGIKTRGASPRLIKIGAKAIKRKGQILQTDIQLTSLLKKGKPPKLIRGDIGFQVSKVEVSKILRGYSPDKLFKGLKTFKPITYKKLTEIIRIPTRKAGVSPTKTLLVTGKVEDIKTIGSKLIASRKTPFSKTFKKGDDVLKKLVQTSSASREITKGSSALDSQLSSAVFPKQTISRASDVKGILTSKPSTDVSLASIGATALISSSRLNLKDLTRSPLRLTPKTISVERGKITPKETTTTKQTQAIKSALRTSVRLTPKIQQDILLSPPMIRTPRTTSPPRIPKVPRIPPFALFLPEGKRRKTDPFSKRRTPSELAYFPDFTARAIGLKPKVVTRKEAERKLKRLLTGLEIRRRLIVK
jgi:hypothetical protein